MDVLLLSRGRTRGKERGRRRGVELQIAKQKNEEGEI